MRTRTRLRLERSSRSFQSRSLDALSRAPVGSSAKTTGGSKRSARAIATRCCSPPLSVGSMVHPPPRVRRAVPWRGPRASGSGPVEHPREEDVLERLRASRLNCWKMIPIRLRRYDVRAVSSIESTRSPPTETKPESARSRPPSRCSGSTCTSARPHHADESGSVDLQVEPSHGLDRAVSGPVALAEVADFDATERGGVVGRSGQSVGAAVTESQFVESGPWMRRVSRSWRRRRTRP